MTWSNDEMADRAPVSGGDRAWRRRYARSGQHGRTASSEIVRHALGRRRGHGSGHGKDEIGLKTKVIAFFAPFSLYV